jgi:hypothetical protein
MLLSFLVQLCLLFSAGFYESVYHVIACSHVIITTWIRNHPQVPIRTMGFEEPVSPYWRDTKLFDWLRNYPQAPIITKCFEEPFLPIGGTHKIV